MRIRTATLARVAPIGFAIVFGAFTGRAQLPAGPLLDAFVQTRSGEPTRVVLPRPLAPQNRRLALIARYPSGGGATPAGLVPITPGLGVFHGTPEAARELASRSGMFVEWSPPRRTLLDEAGVTMGARAAQADVGASGHGVVVGIIDTGVDVSHPDLRNADGTTRIAWFLDFSRAVDAPRSELEAEVCCDQDGCWCTVFDAALLDELVSNSVSGDEPRDTFGHGTHVASLAAGNGLAEPERRYVGVAPSSQLVVARVTQAGGGAIQDADVLLAARFVFDRASDLGMPAVVNLSLGNELGAHDGSSLLEQGLAALVGPERPGRALVVAAGNNGKLTDAEGTGYPGPLGVHTEVHVPRGTSVRVPVILPFPSPPVQDGSVFVWVNAALDDELRVGVDDSQGGLIEPVGNGQVATAERGTLSAVVVHGPGEQMGIDVSTRNALVTLDGVWRAGDVFAVRLEGHGTARLWVESTGDAAPARSGTGALFPRASVQGTVNVPATAAELIAVGATVNRSGWMSRAGSRIEIDAPAGWPGEFSAAGPSAAGALKPELSAPGEWVIGAMAAMADPDQGGGGLFAGRSACAPAGDHCLVVDDHHAIARGTSMAAPLVSGAVALLLEQDPRLTQPEIRALLQAGSTRRPAGSLEQQVGAGVVDVRRSLTARSGDGAGREPAGDQSWLVLSDSFARPGSSVPLSGLVVLRDAAGRPADIADLDRYRLTVSPGSIEEPLRRDAPGLLAFRVRAARGTGGGSLEIGLLLDGAPLLSRRLPIAVDRTLAGARLESSAGCSAAGARSARRFTSPWAAVAAGLLAVRRRRIHVKGRPSGRQSATR